MLTSVVIDFHRYTFESTNYSIELFSHKIILTMLSFSSPVVLSVSILTAIGAYVLFGPEPKDRRKRGLFLF